MFTQVEDGPAVVDVALDGLTDGVEHGWHVHEWPVTDEDCGAESTGGHYNPDGTTMGELSDNLGSLAGASVTAQYETETVSLFGTENIMGRSIVIHGADGVMLDMTSRPQSSPGRAHRSGSMPRRGPRTARHAASSRAPAL